MNFSGASNASASAGWYPTFPGDIIEVEFCLPLHAKSPVFLELDNYPKERGKTVAKISFTKLQSSKDCKDEMKYGVNPTGSGPLDLKYKWKVNTVGGFALQLYVPNLRKTFYGFPDGIDSRKSK
jgi:hypothetical protein